jgi:ABC-type multidrug transport system fused ATPase/permease subunit
MFAVALGSTLVGVAVPLLTKAVVDGPLKRGDRAALWLLGLYALLFGLAEAALILARRLTLANSALGIEQDLRDDLYAHLQRLDVGFHDSWQSGQLVARMTSDISAIRRFVGFGLIFLVVNSITFVVVGVLLIAVNVLLGGLVMVLGVPLMAVLFRYERVYRRQIRAVQDQQGEVATDVEESALGIRTVKAYGRADFLAGHYLAKSVKLRRLQLIQIRTLAEIWSLIIAQPQLVLGLVVLGGSAAVADGSLSLGTLVAFISLYLLLVWPIESTGWLLAASQEANTAAERVFEVLDGVPRITALGTAPSASAEPERAADPTGRFELSESARSAPDSAAVLTAATTATAASPARLAFEHVDFSYPDRDGAPARLVLNDVNLRLAPGETIAVVGTTGCGKTTLTALVPRLYDATAGRILLDGRDVRELPLELLRSQVACAFEDPTLFSASVRENLVLGRPDADAAQIDEALRIAQAEFAHDLPWGLDTRVGEQGLSLSGGQRQRLALARAVLGRPPVLVLDDPLSALDVHTEGLVERALAPCWLRPPDSWSPTAPPPSCSPTGSRCSARTRTAATPSSPSAPTTNCSRTNPRTATCCRRAPNSSRKACDPMALLDTSAPAPQGGKAAEDDWRGVAAEKVDDVTASGGVFLRARSRRLLASLLRPHRRRLALAAGMIVVATTAEMVGPYLVSVGIDSGIPAVKRHDWAPIGAAVSVILLAALAGAALRLRFLKLAGRIGQDMLLDLRERVFRQFQRLPIAFHERYTSGRVISRLTNDLDALGELVNASLDGLVDACLNFVVIGVVLALLDPRLSLFLLACLPALFLLLRWYTRGSRVAYRRTRETIAALIVQFVETLNGIRAVHAFRREPRNDRIFHQLSTDYRDANAAAFRMMAWFMPGIKAVGAAMTATVLVFGGLQVMDHTLQIGVLTAYLLYLRRFFDPLQDLAVFYTSYQSATAALEKLSGVLEEQAAVPEPARPADLPRPLRGELRFEAVRFAYPRREQQSVDGAAHPEKVILPDLDLTIPAGQTVALVGATGAGKSTLARLTCRFYDPDAGAVRLDGVDLRDLRDNDLRAATIMVTQENFLFTGTVADNVRFGRPDATDEQVEAAARAIGAHGFIAALPDGYATDVKKRGGRLSAGQRQLVAFARAFLADPAVLILDEATSSLDVPSERLVQRALRTILAERTALIIAHRLSTVEIADRVLVMEAGRIVEDGSPAELSNSSAGHFAGLHTAWVDSLA